MEKRKVLFDKNILSKILFYIVTAVLCKKYCGNIKLQGIFYIAHKKQDYFGFIAKLEGT